MPVDSTVVTERISDARSAIKDLNRIVSKPYNTLSIDEKYSMRYNIIVLVEAIVALCNHILAEDMNETASSYRESVGKVAEALGIPCTEDLQAIVGLRNLLIHRYHTIADSKIYEYIKTDFKCIEELLRKIEEMYIVDKIL